MKLLSLLGVIFLAVYLIIVGLAGLGGFVLAGVPAVVVHFLALIAGILILITIGQCYHHCHECHRDDK